MSLAPFDVADYFLTRQEKGAGDCISNLKLQKLLYYAQGFHLAIYDKPLFDEMVLAWNHGPVVKSIYRKFKEHKDKSLPIPPEYTGKLTNKQKELLDEIYKVYGKFTAWALRNLSHQEPPWRNTEQNEEISHDELKAYFKTRLA